MKILLVADTEEKFLWDNWSEATAETLSDVALILSAGDLDPDYLEFLVTMMNVPLVYVRGNHDGRYDDEPPQGCISADGTVIEVKCGRRGEAGNVRILGLGGSMQYKYNEPDMYTERQMRARIRKAERALLKYRAADAVFTSADRKAGRPAFDIFLTHAPCRGFGDMDDLPHRGFECFNDLLNKYSPQLHCYGHVHQQYGGLKRQIRHPSGTLLINGWGHYILETKNEAD